MGTAVGITFLGVEIALVALAGLAIIRIGFIRLDTWIGIARDGIPIGNAAPSWSLPDVAGHLRVTPARDRWQFLIFTDRSLVGLPELVDGLRAFAAKVTEAEILLISREGITTPSASRPRRVCLYRRFSAGRTALASGQLRLCHSHLLGGLGWPSWHGQTRLTLRAQRGDECRVVLRARA
jgi:hypothetical protein